MKTYLFYGFMMALAGFVLTLVLFLLGFHSDPAKMAVGSPIGTIGGVLITVAAIVLGLRSARSAVPAGQGYSYGRAVGGGMLITLVSALIGLVTWPLYALVINPQFNEVVAEVQRNKMAAKGMSEDQIDQAMKIAKIFTSPVLETIFAFIAAMLFGLVISLIVAAFFKRQPAAPPLTSAA